MQQDAVEQTLASNDPGDETSRRFRYQWTWAAIVCCLLFDSTQDCIELFCEHHEDILLKLRNGKYRGLQVKTRDMAQGPWKTGEDVVDAALVRFCKLEREFPDQFDSYRFLTNHPLFSGRNGKDLRYVLERLHVASSLAECQTGIARYVRKIAGMASCSEDVALSALKKTTADDSLPKLADVHLRLVTSLTETWDRAETLPYESLTRAARGLVAECMQAASLAHEDLLPAYLPAIGTPSEARLQARIEGKRISVERLRGALDLGLNDASSLRADPSTLIEPGTGDRSLLHKKLDAGGFSAVSRNSADDLRDKADYLGLVWIQKHGREDGLQRYGHVRSLVLSDAAAAFEAIKEAPAPFGVAMLAELRRRLRTRRSHGATLYDCSEEHLEGHAYAMTAECRVQWSLDRPWEDE